MEALVIYHIADYDGMFSGATAKKYFEKAGYNVTTFGYNYGYDDTTIPSLDSFDKICIVDITLPPHIMKDAAARYADKVIWIDHHVTALDQAKAEGYDIFEGKRVSGYGAACLLTYEYFNPHMSVPYAIQLLSAYDVWDHSSFDWDAATSPFQYGLKAIVGSTIEKVYDQYDNILHDPHQYIVHGLSIKAYLDDMYEQWMSKYAFEVEVDGKYKAIAMICPISTSAIFSSVLDKYDLSIVVEKNAIVPGKYNVSMYSEKNIGDFSCGEYMKAHYNGGGHRNAAGGSLDIDQFNRLITDNKI